MRYVWSRRNLVGLGLAVVAGVLGAFGLFGGWWPLAVAGGYVAGAAAAPRESGHSVDVAPEREVQDVRRAFDKMVAEARRHTDARVTNAFERVRVAAGRVLDALGSDPAMAPHLVTLRQIAFEHLPATLENYLNVPNAYRRLRRGPDGRTAQQQLLDQLVLLREQLDAMDEDVARRDLESLAEHGQFLETRFADPLTW